MKKSIFLIVAVLTLLVLLTGCASATVNSDDTVAPEIEILNDSPLIFYTNEYSETELIKHISVIDDTDGDVSKFTIFQPKEEENDIYNARTHGEYILKCIASDKAGNKSAKYVYVTLIDESLRGMQGYWQNESGELLEIRRISFNGDRAMKNSDGSFETEGYSGAFKYTILDDGNIERQSLQSDGVQNFSGIFKPYDGSYCTESEKRTAQKLSEVMAQYGINDYQIVISSHEYEGNTYYEANVLSRSAEKMEMAEFCKLLAALDDVEKTSIEFYSTEFMDKYCLSWDGYLSKNDVVIYPDKNNKTSIKTQNSNSASDINPARHDDTEVWTCAMDAVKRELKAPSTAKFCKYTEAVITDLGNGKYRAEGWVDAENSYGATIRQNFIVTYTATEKGYKDPNVIFW